MIEAKAAKAIRFPFFFYASCRLPSLTHSHTQTTTASSSQQCLKALKFSIA